MISQRLLTLSGVLALAGTLLLSGTLCADVDGSAQANELWNNGDYEAAVAIYQGLADAGQSGAQFRLGQAYEKGLGTAREDYLAHAVRWYLAAAEQGHSEAQNRLGSLYFNGDWKGRIQQNLDTSMQWHRRAAEQGNLDSQFRLGSLMCWHGQQVEGYAWLWLAKSEGMGNAAKELQRVCNRITSDQISTAKQLANSFRSNITANTRSHPA